MFLPTGPNIPYIRASKLKRSCWNHISITFLYTNKQITDSVFRRRDTDDAPHTEHVGMIRGVKMHMKEKKQESKHERDEKRKERKAEREARHEARNNPTN